MRRNFTVEQRHQMITWRYLGPSKEGIVELHLLCWRYWYSLTPRWVWSRHLGDSRKVWCSESSRAGESSFLCNCIGSSGWWWRAKHRPLNKRTWQLPPKSTVPPSRADDVVWCLNLMLFRNCHDERIHCDVNEWKEESTMLERYFLPWRLYSNRTLQLQYLKQHNTIIQCWKPTQGQGDYPERAWSISKPPQVSFRLSLAGSAIIERRLAASCFGACSHIQNTLTEFHAVSRCSVLQTACAQKIIIIKVFLRN